MGVPVQVKAVSTIAQSVVAESKQVSIIELSQHLWLLSAKGVSLSKFAAVAHCLQLKILLVLLVRPNQLIFLLSLGPLIKSLPQLNSIFDF